MSTLHHRRKGGALDVDKKTIVVRYEGREHTVSWFSGASDEAISRTIDNALGLPPGSAAVIRDPEDGSALAISDSLPDGLTLDAKAASTPTAELHHLAAASAASASGSAAAAGASAVSVTWNSQLGGDGGGKDARSGIAQQPPSRSSDDGFHGDSDDGKQTSGGVGMRGGAQEFRGELLKFERVNAHLANERTWLAWVRTALSVLGIALSLLSLMDDMGSYGMDSLALLLGVAFVLCTLFTYLTGWLRYTRVKKVLTWTGSQVKGRFGRFGLQYFTRFLGVALVFTVPLYMYGGVQVVQDS